MNKMNLLGILAVIFGGIGTICCCCPWLKGAPLFGGIPAIVLGFLHLQRVKKGQATMGWMGWVGIGLGILAIVIGICTFTSVGGQYQDDWQDQFNNFGDF